MTSGPQTGPWPGTIVVAPKARNVSSAPSAPTTEPISTNGVPPLKTRSPANITRSAGSQATTSPVVCAGVPMKCQLGQPVPNVKVKPVVEDERRRRDGEVPPGDLAEDGLEPADRLVA